MGLCVFYLGRWLAVWLTVHNVHGFFAFLDNVVAAIAAGFVVLFYERWRQRGVDKLRESEERFRLVANAAPALIWMSGTDKLCTYFNKPWLDFTGRSMDSELGNGWTEGVHPEDLQRCLGTYARAFDRREEFTMEYQLRHRNGDYRWIFDIGVPRFNQDASFVGYIGICVDITDRKMAEVKLHESQEALRTSEERLRLAQKVARIGSFEWNVQTGANIWTPELEAMYGLPSGGFGGTQSAFESLVHPDDRARIRELVDMALKSGQPMGGEWRVVLPDGSVHWIAGRWQVFVNESGEPSRVIGVNIDVTDQKLAEEARSDMTRQLVKAQEQERARIARELHDDVNQRLAMLAVELEQLKENPSEVESRAEELRKHTSDISNDVQALSHDLHSSQLEYLGAVAGMKSWCKEFAGRQKMEIDCRHDVRSTLPLEIGLCLLRVLQEALHNAVKHSGVNRIEVQLAEYSNQLHLTVKDSGKGFDIGVAQQGRGLGLTSMQERVRLVNGTISIESKPMVGTTIHVRVPLGSKDSSQRAAG